TETNDGDRIDSEVSNGDKPVSVDKPIDEVVIPGEKSDDESSNEDSPETTPEVTTKSDESSEVALEDATKEADGNDLQKVEELKSSMKTFFEAADQFNASVSKIADTLASHQEVISSLVKAVNAQTKLIEEATTKSAEAVPSVMQAPPAQKKSISKRMSERGGFVDALDEIFGASKDQ